MMDLFDKKPIVPVDVLITLAINIVVVLLGYYLHGVGTSRGLIDITGTTVMTATFI